MSPDDVVAAVFVIVGFFVTLYGLIVVVAKIIDDVLAQFRGEQDFRQVHDCGVEHLSGRPEFFRPRYARNRRA